MGMVNKSGRKNMLSENRAEIVFLPLFESESYLTLNIGFRLSRK